MDNYTKYGQDIDAILAEISEYEQQTKEYAEKAVAAHDRRTEAQERLDARRAELRNALDALTQFMAALVKLPPLVSEVDAQEKARIAEQERLEEEKLAKAKADREAQEEEDERLRLEELAKEAAENATIPEPNPEPVEEPIQESVPTTDEAPAVSEAPIFEEDPDLPVTEAPPSSTVDEPADVTSEPSEDILADEPPANEGLADVDPLTGLPRAKI